MADLVEEYIKYDRHIEAANRVNAREYYAQIYHTKFENSVENIVWKDGPEREMQEKRILTKNRKIFCIDSWQRTSLDIQKNLLKVQCVLLRNNMFVQCRSHPLRLMLLQYLTEINAKYGVGMCQFSINMDTGEIKAKTYLYSDLHILKVRVQELKHKIKSFQILFHEIYVLLLGFYNQLPKNLKFIKQTSKQSEFLSSCEEQIYTSVLEVPKSFSQSSFKSKNEEEQTKLAEKLMGKRTLPLENKLISLYSYQKQFQNLTVISLEESPKEKEKRQKYLHVQILKNKEFLYNEIQVLNPEQFQLGDTNLRGGGSKILLAKLQFRHVVQQKVKESERRSALQMKYGEKLPTKFFAIKVPLDESKVFKKRKQHEIKIVQLLSSAHSPFFLKYYLSFTQNFKFKNTLMMDMAFNYHPLSRFVEKKRATLSLTAKIYILISMAQSLRFLKIREIVHMDFNPRNILISENYSCKLIDFGESYHRKLCSQNYSPGFTLPFTPPEYFSSRDFTNKYDIYSYGVIMLQLIFSILPFEKHYSIIDVLKNKQSKERVLYIPENCQQHGEEVLMNMLFAFMNKMLCEEIENRPHASKTVIFLRDLFYRIKSLIQN